MPRHQQVTTCRRSGGPLSKHCTCEHCTLVMCSVCGAYEGGLTTDCPGVKIDFDTQREIYETPLDYTDARGWHQGLSSGQRAPCFLTTRRMPEVPRVDPRVSVAPAIDWVTVDRSAGLQQELALRAIAWVLADRTCDDLSARVARSSGDEGTMNFQRACRLVDECDEAFRQAARQLVSAMEVSTRPELMRPLQGPPLEAGVSVDTVRPLRSGLLAEIKGEITHEHLPRAFELLDETISALLDALEVHVPHLEALPLEQLAVAQVDAVWAAREACRRLGVPPGWLNRHGWRGGLKKGSV